MTPGPAAPGGYAAHPYAPPEALAAAPPGWWFFGAPPQVQGPIAADALRAMLRAGQLPLATPVWSQGMTGFVPAGSVLGLTSDDDAVLGLIVPMGPQSTLAIVAGYVGLFSIILWPIGWLGILLGVLALRDLKQNPHKKGWGRAITGIVVGTIGTALLAWIVLTAALA